MTLLPALAPIMPDLPEGIGVELRRLYEGARANSGLLASDYMTARDLLELSGYAGEDSLHALLLVMLTALDEGSLCVEITPERLASRIADLAGPEAVGLWPQRIVDSLRDHRYPALIAPTESPAKPIVRLAIGDRIFLYFQKLYQHEQVLSGLIQRRLGDSCSTPLLHDLPGVLHEVLDERPLATSSGKLRLNPEQRLALALALFRPLVLVSGGPGTGKTSIVLTVLRCLARRPGFNPERIALAAPTGRAAQRLTDSLRQGLESLQSPLASADVVIQTITAQTVHRLLGYQPNRGTFRHHSENPLAVDIVIIDEISMVGLELMSNLFQSLPTDARIVLLGDKDQLPSVDAGAVLANLMSTNEQAGYSRAIRDAVVKLFPDLTLPETASGRLRDVLVVLEKNHRSQLHIQEIARAVNAQDDEAVLAVPTVPVREVSFGELEKSGGCCRLEDTGDSLRWRNVLLRWAEHYYCTRRDGRASFLQKAQEIRVPASSELSAAQQVAFDDLFETLNQARVLTLVRDGAWGATGINQFMEQELRRRLGPGHQGRLFAGAAVLITRNDYQLQLFNGDVGLTVRTVSDGYRVVFPRMGTYLSLSVDILPAHELAYAMTVHKSQGAEYDNVLLVLPPQGGRRLLTKEMIYTGITRARGLAVIAASVEVLQMAIRRRVQREANLLR